MHRSIGKVATRFFEFDNLKKPLELRVGGKLSRFTLAYEMYGRMNADRSNVILVFHAMTGSQHAAGLNRRVPGLDSHWTEELHEGWWDAFIGPGKSLDTRKFCVLCANYLGGCYGSTGPSSINPKTGRPWGPPFPVLRIVDIVESQLKLLVFRMNLIPWVVAGIVGLLLLWGEKPKTSPTPPKRGPGRPRKAPQTAQEPPGEAESRPWTPRPS